VSDIQDYGRVRAAGDNWESIEDEDSDSFLEMHNCESEDPADCEVVFARPSEEAIDSMIRRDPP
jgi:hypothetical protein